MYSIIRNKVAEGVPIRQLWTACGLTRSMMSRALTEGYKGGTSHRQHKPDASTAEDEAKGDIAEPKKKRKWKHKTVIKGEVDP